MSININRNLPGNAYDAAVGANTPSGINPYATIADIPQTVSSGTQLLTGGASWSGTGMVFDVTVLTYQISGVNYSSAATSVTLPVGDPSDPRFDAIVVNEFGVVLIIAGIPSSNPITPTIPGDQVLVQYVLVNAGAITPAITDEWVYRESQAGDWVGSIIGGAPAPTAVWNSPTPAPFAGTACLLASYSAYSTSRFIRLQAPSPISRSTYVGLSLRVYLPVNFATLDGGLGRSPFIQLRGGPSLTSLGTRYLDQHGLNLSLVGVWQQVTIPTALFTGSVTIADIRTVDLFLLKNAAVPNTYVNIAYDNIVFQSGFGTVSSIPTIDILEQFTTIGSTSKLNFIDGPGTDLTIANDTLNNKIDVTIAANGQFQIYNNGTDTGLILDQTNQNTLIVQDVSTTGDIGLPLNSFQPIAIGSVFKVTNIGSATVFITTAPGVILNSRSSLNGIDSPHGVVTLTKTATNVWLLEGDLV
jgi:hypothetical protein